jgi:hypothetical protein
MERVSEPLAQLLPVTSSASIRSDELARSSMMNTLEDLMAQVQSNYPAQSVNPQTGKVWLKLWTEMATMYGIRSFKQAVWALLKKTHFLPLPAEINVELEALVQREEQRLRAKKFVRAEGCQCTADTDGYVLVSYQPGKPGGAFRCDCWKAWKRERDQSRGD